MSAEPVKDEAATRVVGRSQQLQETEKCKELTKHYQTRQSPTPDNARETKSLPNYKLRALPPEKWKDFEVEVASNGCRQMCNAHHKPEFGTEYGLHYVRAAPQGE